MRRSSRLFYLPRSRCVTHLVSALNSKIGPTKFSALDDNQTTAKAEHVEHRLPERPIVAKAKLSTSQITSDSRRPRLMFVLEASRSLLLLLLLPSSNVASSQR